MCLRKDKQAIRLVVFLLFSVPSFGQAGKSFKYQFDGNLSKCDIIAGNQSVILDYSIRELNIVNIVNEYGSFYRVSIPGHIAASTPGKPELPVLSRLISIPEGADWKIKISEVRSQNITPSEKKIEGILYPVQEGETKEAGKKKPVFLIDKTAYATRGLLSSDTVSIEFLGTLRNKKLADLYISPVRYNPLSNSLEVITSMKIEITFPVNPRAVSKSLIPESALFNKSLNKGTLDFNPGDVVPGYSDQPVKMVIITDTAFRKQLEPFIRWKTQKGFRLNVLYKGTGLAGNTFSELKDTLTKIYQGYSETDAPPEYLLIIGDVNRVPYYGAGSGNGNITDMYYGEFNGNGDYIPEMYIGRLPVADTTELKSVINKIIQYEKFEFADSNKFYTRALITAGNDVDYADYMNGQVKYSISNYLNSANKINESHFYYPQSTTSSTLDSLKKLINNGVSFLNYTGHGSSDGWLFTKNGTSYYLSGSDIPGMLNKNMYPFIFSNACRTAQFNLSSSFGNKMVLASEKGAIGFIGCSNDSYWDEDFFWSVGACTPSADPTYLTTGPGAYDRMFHTHGEPASDWYLSMGQINYAGNMAVSSSTSPMKKYYWETYNLIGDPSVIPIVGRPESFKISLPDTLPNGIKSLSINADPFAYVAVSHFDTLWDASFVSPSGSVTIKMPGLSNDSCLVVITGQNKYPIIKKIYFSDIKDEYVNLTATSINDSQGNNNGRADFGETFYLKLTINNLGLSDTRNLYAKITSSSDWVTINKDSVQIGTLASKTEISLPVNLSLTISNNVPDLETVTINLTLKDSKSEKHYIIDICVHAPQLQIISCLIDDTVLGNGNHIADPGETFKLVFRIRNQGSSNISGLFNIVSSENEITILEPNIKSGELKFGEITEIPITVKLSESAVAGSYISISSTLDCTPLIVTKNFAFRVGRIRESFEASSFSVFPWININPVPWTITSASSYDGSFSARSGSISHSSKTSLVIRTVYSFADSLSFFYKVSSEPGYDNFSFKLNDTEIFRKSGETSWSRKVIAVPAGLNKMEWIYTKDNSVSVGSDCAWIDMIDFSESAPVRYIQKDLEVAKISAPVQTDKYGLEIVSVKVLNLGKDTIDGFNLAYELAGHSPVKQFFENKIIPFGDSVIVAFKTKADLSKYGIYKIVAYGYDNNDDYLLNDTVKICIENTEINESLSVFPNPFIDHFTVFFNSRVAEKLQISIINISGEKLYSIEKYVLGGKNELIISDIRLSPSIYYLNIRGISINKTLPILKVIK